MMRGVFLVLMFSVFVSLVNEVTSQTIFSQTIFYGGITAGGFSSGEGVGSGTVNLYIEPGSSIRKAYLLAYSVSNAEDSIYINNTGFYVGQNSIVTSFSHTVSSFSLINLHIIDISNWLSNNFSTSFNIEVPLQSGMPFSAVYSPFILVEYENNSLPLITSTIILNNKNLNGSLSYNIQNLNPMNNSNPIGLSIFIDRITSFMSDQEIIVVEGSTLGALNGPDNVNNLFDAGGVKGHFFYQNNQLYGLDDDTPDNIMGNSDGLADISSYVTNLSNSLSFQLTHVNFPNQTNGATNVNLAYFLTYTSPCDTFSVTTPNDTTVCEGTQTQLNVTGGQTYEWSSPSAPSGVVPGLSCSTCPDPIFTADSSMFYTVRIWNNDSCSVVRPLKINVRPRPVFGAITTTPSECGAPVGSSAAGSVTLSAEPNNNIVESWLVDGVLTSSMTTTGLVSGNHTVSFIDTNGCESLDSVVFVDEVNSTLADFTVNPTSGAAPLNVSIMNTSQNASNFEWFTTTGSATSSTGVMPPSFFNTSGDYVIQLVAWQFDPSCADTAFKIVFVYDSLLIQLPNVFTPNGDGTNDFFNVSTNLPLRYELVILNRWGNVVFETEQNISVGSTNLWNGKTKQNEVHEGVYFYQLHFDASEDTPEGLKADFPLEKTGFVEVKR